MAIVESGIPAHVDLYTEECEGTVSYDAGKNRPLTVLTGESPRVNSIANAFIHLQREAISLFGTRRRINFYETAKVIQILQSKLSADFMESRTPANFRALIAIAAQNGHITFDQADQLTYDYNALARYETQCDSILAHQMYAFAKKENIIRRYPTTKQTVKLYALIIGESFRGSRKQEQLYDEILNGAIQLLS